ncbi:MAG: hypothetical protein R3E65_12010 [Steroidobacteraceae bacterium]
MQQAYIGVPTPSIPDPLLAPQPAATMASVAKGMFGGVPRFWTWSRSAPASGVAIIIADELLKARGQHPHARARGRRRHLPASST